MPVLDTSLLIENRVQAVREFQQAANLGRAQIDISGGVDSATVGALLVLALGADNVTAVFSGIHSSPMARNLAHRQAEQQMLHGGIAADRDISNVMRGEAEGAREIVTQRIDRRASGGL